MGPFIIDGAAGNSVVVRLKGVSVKDGRLVCETFVMGDDCPEGKRVSAPIEDSLNPILEIGAQPKHLLVIVCENREDLERYSHFVSQAQSR